MPAATLPATPSDLSTIATSLAVFSLAIAAVVGGIWKGLREVKKGGADTGTTVAAGVIMGSATVTALIDSNTRLCESNRDVIRAFEKFDHRVDRLIDALEDNREMTRGQLEEQHRLRAAVTDLVEIMRRRAT